VVGVALTLLTPEAAAVGVPALLAVAGAVYGLRRAAAVRRVLRLPEPPPARARVRIALVAAVVALLTLAAAQPALTRDRHLRARDDAQVLFVLDTSRSMAASARPGSPTRLDRAAAAAARLRRAVPTVAAGVATLTDRVLPDLLPVPDVPGFDRVLGRGVAIESPPPQASAVRATSYDALQQIPGAGYFDPKARSRTVVVLTDGESAPVQTDEVAAAFASPRYHLLFVRFSHPGEAIYDEGGRAETAYRPDPSGGAVLDSVASSVGARAYDEGSVGDAERALARLVGTGRETELAGTVRTATPLAPFIAAAALLCALALLGFRAGRVPWAAP
jgi:hypothetical protein